MKTFNTILGTLFVVLLFMAFIVDVSKGNSEAVLWIVATACFWLTTLLWKSKYRRYIKRHEKCLKENEDRVNKMLASKQEVILKMDSENENLRKTQIGLNAKIASLIAEVAKLTPKKKLKVVSKKK